MKEQEITLSGREVVKNPLPCEAARGQPLALVTKLVSFQVCGKVLDIVMEKGILGVNTLKYYP